MVTEKIIEKLWQKIENDKEYKGSWGTGDFWRKEVAPGITYGMIKSAYKEISRDKPLRQ